MSLRTSSLTRHSFEDNQVIGIDTRLQLDEPFHPAMLHSTYSTVDIGDSLSGSLELRDTMFCFGWMATSAEIFPFTTLLSMLNGRCNHTRTEDIRIAVLHRVLTIMSSFSLSTFLCEHHERKA